MTAYSPAPKKKYANAAALLALLAVLGGILAAFGGPWAQKESAALAVCLPKGPAGYGAFPLVGDQNHRYAVALESDAQAILAALRLGSPDAALIPAECLGQLDRKVYVPAAVTACKNLVAVQNGGRAKTIIDLDGGEAILPLSLQGTPEHRMLACLLEQTNVTLSLTFESSASIGQRAETGDFPFLLLPADQCAAVLIKNENYRSCFNLASQWRSFTGTQPPAGSVLVVRAGEDRPALTALLADMKTGIDYANTKHKKASRLIFACGFGESAALVYKTLPHCALVYLEGEEMAASLEALAALMQEVTSTPDIVARTPS